MSKIHISEVEAILGRNMNSVHSPADRKLLENTRKILADKIAEPGCYSVKIQGITDITDLSAEGLKAVEDRLQKNGTQYTTYRDIGKGRKVLLKDWAGIRVLS